MSEATVHGIVEPGFGAVHDAFVTNFEKGELGAAVCAYVDGRKVVDLWGGWADADRTRPWHSDTMVCLYSATKAMTATCAHQLVERGVLDLDEPIASYWPEFAQAGKDKITMRMVLSHQAGLPWTTAPYPKEKFLDWAIVTDALARSAPVWEPGTKSEYHGGTFGFLVGEVVKRIDGRPLGEFSRQEIADPLRADFLVDVGPEDDDRCADVVGDVDAVNTREWRAAGDGAATGHGSADGVARVFAALAGGGELDGVRVLRAETIDTATQEQPLVHGEGTAGEFGLGYQLLWKLKPDLGQGAHSFCHTGMGGSIGVADPDRRLGFAYVMNKMHSGGLIGPLTATYEALLG